VGGSSVRFTGDEPDNVPSATLLGLGNILWANRYTFGTTGAYANPSHVAGAARRRRSGSPTRRAR
jgi:hypothetical protein